MSFKSTLLKYGTLVGAGVASGLALVESTFATVVVSSGGVITVPTSDVTAAGSSILSMAGTYVNLFIQFLPYLVTFVAIYMVIGIFKKGAGMQGR